MATHNSHADETLLVLQFSVGLEISKANEIVQHHHNHNLVEVLQFVCFVIVHWDCLTENNQTNDSREHKSSNLEKQDVSTEHDKEPKNASSKEEKELVNDHSFRVLTNALCESAIRVFKFFVFKLVEFLVKNKCLSERHHNTDGQEEIASDCVDYSAESKVVGGLNRVD